MSQNPYDQNPRQPQMPYAQPYQAGYYGAVPEKKPEPNSVVKTGIYLIYGFALYMLLSGIYNMVTFQDRMDQVMQQQRDIYSSYGSSSAYSGTADSSVVAAGIIIGLVMALVMIIITVIIGYFYSKGHGWARITALVLSSIGTAFSAISLVASLIALAAGSAASSPYASMSDPLSTGLTIISMALQIAIIVYLVRRDAAQYTTQSSIWRTYQQNRGAVNPYQQGYQPYSH